MERRTQNPQTPLQRKEELFDELAELMRKLGHIWMGEAIGYGKQSISNYSTRLRGSKRLEKLILANFERALDIKMAHYVEEDRMMREAFKECLIKIQQKKDDTPQILSTEATKKPHAREQAALEAA